MKLHLLVLTYFVPCVLFSQDTLPQTSKKLSVHWQGTIIPQYHFNFNSPYSGENSFQASEPPATSISTTIYLAYKPFKNTYLVFNPEAVGGKGLSKTQGIAGFPNGEVYRVGNPKLTPFIARLYAEQRIPLTATKTKVDDDFNQIVETTSKDYLSLLVGKFSLTDFFDDTQISNDPRTQFFNWSLFGNGAWDYPANTRGYTIGFVSQLFYKGFTLKYANTAVPTEANGTDLEYQCKTAAGNVIEFGVEKFGIFKKPTQLKYHAIRIGLFSNKANMGDYATSIATAIATNSTPDITNSRQIGRKKSGYYISLDNHFGAIHHFVKYSYNDGDHESWAFTEIDKSVATGFRFDGSIWKKPKDAFGIAYVHNDISSAHQDYLKHGGYGFIVGDGKLNYGSESVLECYYSCHIFKKIFISPDYQLITNPGYNKDRGPVHVIAVRLHIEL